jgi:hypothetical protein
MWIRKTFDAILGGACEPALIVGLQRLGVLSDVARKLKKNSTFFGLRDRARMESSKSSLGAAILMVRPLRRSADPQSVGWLKLRKLLYLVVYFLKPIDLIHDRRCYVIPGCHVKVTGSIQKLLLSPSMATKQYTEEEVAKVLIILSLHRPTSLINLAAQQGGRPRKSPYSFKWFQCN